MKAPESSRVTNKQGGTIYACWMLQRGRLNPGYGMVRLARVTENCTCGESDKSSPSAVGMFWIRPHTHQGRVGEKLSERECEDFSHSHSH
ncbi:hypothetical protein ACLOJK_001205 [Asimina triloba]